MVRNAADNLAANKEKEGQSSLDNIHAVNQSLTPSPSSSAKQYYLDSNSEQTV